MPTISIKGRTLSYEEDQVITFAEGLIGMPDMRRAVLLPMDELAPFCWLASIDSEKNRFIVVDPNLLFDGYAAFPEDHDPGRKLETLAIVKVSTEWEKTTVNLRAPLVINRKTQEGAQLILADTEYQFAQQIVGGK